MFIAVKKINYWFFVSTLKHFDEYEKNMATTILQIQIRIVNIFHWKEKQFPVFGFCIILQCPIGKLSVDKEGIKTIDFILLYHTCNTYMYTIYIRIAITTSYKDFTPEYNDVI